MMLSKKGNRWKPLTSVDLKSMITRVRCQSICVCFEQCKKILKQTGTRLQGVCSGLSEVMASAGKHQLVTFMGDLIPTIRTALCDSVSEVREAAGLAFSTLYKVVCLLSNL